MTGSSPPYLYALSVRQPWAWLIVHGHKTFENRDWSPNYAPRQFVKNQAPFRCLIHASSGITKAEYQACRDLVWTQFAERGIPPIELPSFQQLERGMIIGAVTIAGWSSTKLPDNPWSFGSGLILTNPELLPYTPCKGALGFFRPSF